MFQTTNQPIIVVFAVFDHGLYTPKLASWKTGNHQIVQLLGILQTN
jgi:hypothetical protein